MTVRKFLLAAFIASIAGPAFASCTWTTAGAAGQTSKAVCTTGTEAVSAAAYAADTTYAAGALAIYDGNLYGSLQGSNTGHTPSTSATWWSLVGMSLANATTYNLVVCANTAGQWVTDGSAIDFYFWDARVGRVIKTDTSITVPQGTSAVHECVMSKADSPAWGQPVVSRAGRLFAVPNAAAVSSGSIQIWLLPSNASGQAL